jgi:DNA-binding NarL/FixJ family response regulator
MSENAVSLSTIRLVLVAEEGIRREIVHSALEQEPDLTLVDEVRGCRALEEALRHAPADVVIWALNGQDMPSACPSIFRRYPRLKVLTIRDDGRRSFLWELLPTRRALGELSSRQLVAVIREEFAR